jgi:hypothetical protein
MYVEMWQGSEILLRRAEREVTGNYWVLMSTLLLTVFTLKAYLNHIGPKLFKGSQSYVISVTNYAPTGASS